MSELLFRLILNGKIVGFEKWYSGAQNKDTKQYEALPGWLYSKDEKYWNPQPIFHRKKEQYTGRNDKNKMKIFEGDICRTPSVIYPIEFDKEIICFGKTILYYVHELEKIGNIHDNSELLEAKP